MIFLLKNLKPSWDMNNEILVRAKTEAAARKMANAKLQNGTGDTTGGDFGMGREGPIWEDNTKTSCTIVEPDGPDEILMVDYYEP